MVASLYLGSPHFLFDWLHQVSFVVHLGRPPEGYEV